MSESFSYENLLGGSQAPIVNVAATLKTGDNLPRGAIVGRVTSTGKWNEAELSALADYDQLGILAVATDASLADALTSVYVRGEFTEAGVTYYYGNTAADWREALAEHGIFLRASISVLGQ